ncbi:MAG: hypothetical protein WAO09_10610 [Candidatus Dormiibacterota bacterium]
MEATNESVRPSSEGESLQFGLEASEHRDFSLIRWTPDTYPKAGAMPSIDIAREHIACLIAIDASASAK